MSLLLLFGGVSSGEPPPPPPADTGPRRMRRYLTMDSPRRTRVRRIYSKGVQLSQPLPFRRLAPAMLIQR